MKKSHKIISILLAMSVLFSNSITAVHAKRKSNYLKEEDYPFCCRVTKDEYFHFDDPLAEDDPLWSIYRTDFGLVAKNVKKVWVSANVDSVLISTKKNEVKEIDFSHRKNKGDIRYQTSLISKDNERIFSPCNGEWYLKNEKGEVFYSGYGTCYSVWRHRSAAECNKASDILVKHQRILKNVKKCWSGAGMFAYVQDNSLKITGSGKAMAQNTPYCCWRVNTVDTYLEGKGDQIKEVVCTGSRFDFAKNPWCVFVLMKDGSVWGMGSNECKMLSSKKKKFSETFEMIIPGGVKKIRAGGGRVAIIKNDKTLWMWGKGGEAKDAKCSFTPVKVADDVKDISIGGQGAYMLILKTDHTAYGLGSGDRDFVFTKKHTKKWYAKPIQLMKNVKKVYAFGKGRASLILTRKNELYWTGNIDFNWLYYEWMEEKTWKLPLFKRESLVTDKKLLKMLKI